MPDQAGSPASWDSEHSDYAQYLLKNKQDIGQVLRSVMNGSELVTAYFDHGQRFFLTSILAVNPSEDLLVFDYGIDSELNQRALEASHAVFVTSQERVRVQFSTGRLTRFDFQGQPAFRTALPAVLLKLQRREYYRLATPIRLPLACTIPTETGRVDANVTDLGIGGVGLTGLPPDFDLGKGRQYPGCRIALPQEGTILVTLEIRSTHETTLRSGGAILRAGCAFVDLPSSQQAMIQRYIIRIDRERLALVKGR